MKNMDKYGTLEEMYTDNRKLVFTYITDYTKDLDLIEELASTIWVKTWEHGDIFLKMDKKGTKHYLRAMTKTVVSDYFRRLKKEKKAFEDAVLFMEPWDSMEVNFLKENMEYYLKESLEILTEEERLLITMRFLHNMSAKEMSDVLEIKEGTVRVRQLRIIAKLRSRIKELMDEGEWD